MDKVCEGCKQQLVIKPFCGKVKTYFFYDSSAQSYFTNLLLLDIIKMCSLQKT